MPMKLTRIEIRCDHGFLEGSGLCPACEGGSAIRDEAKVTTEILVPGFMVGGSTITRKRGDTTMEMACGCGELFITTRSALLKVRNRQTRSCCAKCRRFKPHGLEGKYTCTACGEEKPKSEFYASKTDSRGHQSKCKTCDNNKRGRSRADVVTKEESAA
jgi:hypothetical protein